MTQQPNSIFPISFNYNGKVFETKALKCAGKHETLYKIALPSSVSPVQQYWISNSSGQWKLIMGVEADKHLMRELITAIKNYENIASIYIENVRKSALKSA